MILMWLSSTNTAAISDLQSCFASPKTDLIVAKKRVGGLKLEKEWRKDR